MASAFQNLWNKWTGKGITDAQKEVNAFNANEAQKARDFEQQMSNTAYQRQTADMIAAGVNPALTMGGTSNGASTPNGEAASAGADPTGGLDMSSLMSLLMSPLSVVQGIENIKGIQKENELKDKQISWYDKEHEGAFAKLNEEIAQLRAQISGLTLDNEAKGIINSYLDRQQAAELRVKNANADNLEKMNEEIDKRIEKMDVEELKMFVEMCEIQEQINYLQSQEALNQAQIRELDALVNKLNKEARLLQLNIDNFDDLNVIGNVSTSQSLGGLTFSENVSESHPQTLGDKKRAAEKRIRDKEEQDKADKEAGKPTYKDRFGNRHGYEPSGAFGD